MFFESEKPYVVEVHIADIHFGAIDPGEQYMILMEQFINKISTFHFDILSIDGDIFDRKFMANSDAVMYAMAFVRNCAELCVARGATLIIISGTESHDANQIKLFYNYKDGLIPGLDFRIVESAQFQYAQGLKILCIPEEYGKGSRTVSPEAFSFRGRPGGFGDQNIYRDRPCRMQKTQQ